MNQQNSEPSGALVRLTSCDSIVPSALDLTQYSEARSQLSPSSILSEQSQQQTTVPPLPPHLDKLIDQPWSKEASLLVDSQLWYIQQEIELVGGKP